MSLVVTLEDGTEINVVCGPPKSPIEVRYVNANTKRWILFGGTIHPYGNYNGSLWAHPSLGYYSHELVGDRVVAIHKSPIVKTEGELLGFRY